MDASKKQEIFIQEVPGWAKVALVIFIDSTTFIAICVTRRLTIWEILDPIQNGIWTTFESELAG